MNSFVLLAHSHLWNWVEGQFSPKIIFSKEIGKEVRRVAFSDMMRLSSTSFDCHVARFMWELVHRYFNPLTSITYYVGNG